MFFILSGPLGYEIYTQSLAIDKLLWFCELIMSSTLTKPVKKWEHQWESPSLPIVGP